MKTKTNDRKEITSLKLIMNIDQKTKKQVITVTHKKDGPLCSLVLRAWDRHHKLSMTSVYDLIYRSDRVYRHTHTREDQCYALR